MIERDTTAPREPIAVIGIGCRLPGADGPDAFWRLLVEGRDAIREIPGDRFDVDALFDERPATPGRIMTRWGGFLDGLDRFDAQFFGISPREADRLDPQQRLLLEVGWEALEDAGQSLQRLDGAHTGVFVGTWLNDYESRLFRNPRAVDFYMTTGTGRYSASGRLSYAFGFEGPSITVDCACSSSLVAVHLACRSLWSGESTLALAGGSNVILEPYIHIAYSQSRMMAPDGRCKFGDARADGYVRSEGAAIVVLKPLARAVADGDPIYATIIGSAVNNDGRSSGFMATPGQAGQETMLRRAYADAGVSPGGCQYVEAHGTGTRAGDPVEIGAIGAVLGIDRPADSPCRVGSVKTNIGHTEGAAGVSGLIKVALALKHRQIPPSLHCEELNPDIPWKELRVQVHRELTPWPTGGQAIGGVSSFGIAGTNAHVVMAEAPLLPFPTPDADGPKVLPLSARTPEALVQLARTYAEALNRVSDTPFPDACYTAAVRRTHHEHRVTTVGRTAKEAAESLEAFANGEPRPGLAAGRAAEDGARKVVFVFPGQGSQWFGMGRALMASEAVFAEALSRCDAAVQTLTGWSVINELQADQASSRLDRIDVVQPVLFSIQVALATLWRSWGIEPAAVVGHSMGEIAAAHVSGALSIEDAARIICRRSALLRRTSGQGAMAVVELSLDAAREAIAGFEDRLSVAVSNSSRSTVLSGDPAALDELLPRLEAREIFCRRVKVDVASHSPQMDALRDDLLAAIEGIEPRHASVPFCSTVVGTPVEGNTLMPSYWSRNLREPVLFSTTVRRLVEDGHSAFIEMSPHPLLVGAVHEIAADVGSTVLSLPSGRRDEDERAVILGSLGALHCVGIPVDWSRLFPAGGRIVPLPAYPWQRERFWFDAPAAAESRRTAPSQDMLGEPLRPSLQSDTWYWEFELGLESAPYLSDHRVRSSVVVPAALFVELALEAARRALGDGVQALERLTVGAALVVPEPGTRLVQIAVTTDGPQRGTVRIFSRDGDRKSTAPWTEHANGGLRVARVSADTQGPPPEAIQARCASRFDANAHYEALSRRGLEYGSAFRGVESGWRSDNELLVRVQVPLNGDDPAGQLQFRAAALDACLQALVTLVPADSTVDASDTFVPVAIESLDVHRKVQPGDEVWCHLTITSRSQSGDTFEGDLRLLDRGGVTIAEASGVRLYRIERARDVAARESVYQLAWRPEVRSTPVSDGDGEWLIVQGDPAIAAAIAARITARGGRVEIAPPAQAGADIATRQRRGVVYAAGSKGGAVSSDLSIEAFGVVKALAGLEPMATRLWFVTAGAQAVSPGDRVEGVAASTLWGLRSVADSEYPSMKCSAVDLSAAHDGTEIESLVDELLGDGVEREVALRGTTRSVRRLRRGVEEAKADAEPTAPAAGRPYRAITSSPGILDGLELQETTRRAPTGRDVEIEVAATGLNFMNVMSALGIYPGAPQGVGPLGIECAGRVVRVGPEVERCKPGDDVMAFARDSLATHAIADERLVAQIPAGLDVREAATIPVAFLTAYYALVRLGRLGRSERVLIHSATGGVGLAALQIARRVGAEIFATAGTAEKRELLRSMGIAHVADSRSLDFVDAFTAATNGEGVDVVLNSLAGGAIPAGLSLLRGGGRFVEIGKRDIYENRTLELFPFRKNLSYFAIDLDRLSCERPDVLGAMLGELVPQFEHSSLTPLPAEVFPVSQTAEAFRLMAQGAHTGKIVIAIDPENAPVRRRRSGTPRDWSAGTYLISGGTGGLGLEVARWMAGEGARRLVLMGRRGEDPDLTTRLQPLRQAGVTVHVARGDVALAEDVNAVIREIDAVMPPLAGIVHAAGILDDGTIAQLDAKKFERVLAPKVSGAWNLHTATADRPLDFFVMFSSVTSFIGSSGQANYAAANAFLDSLAAHRRSHGQPALSINWGPWSDVGLAAERSDRGARLAEHGLGSLAPPVGIVALRELIRRNPVQAAVMPFDARRWCEGVAGTTTWPLFSELISETADVAQPAQPESLREALEAVPPGRRRRALLENHVQQTVAQVLKLAASRVDVTKPLRTMGLDSLMGLELRNRLELASRLSLPATLIWNYPTVEQLSAQLATRMEISLEETTTAVETATGATVPAETVGQGAIETMLAEIESLSDEEARRLLAGEV